MRKGSFGLTALLAVLALAVPISAQATAPGDSKKSDSGYEKVYWDLPAAYKGWPSEPPPGDTFQQVNAPNIWPQTYDPHKKACGGWWQWDIYDTNNPKIKAALDHAKANGLTYMAVQEVQWDFERQPECKEIPKKKITPKPPILTHPTGKCWAGEWKVADNGEIKLPKVAHARWVGYGAAETLTGLAPGTYEFTLKADKGATIKDVNGFVDGKISVELKTPPQTDDCAPPPAKVKKGKWSKLKIDCDAGEATKTRRVWTTEYVWSKHKRDWVLDYKNAQTAIESKTRALTKHESAQCPAPINVPPPQVLEGDWETTSTLCYLGVVSQMREVTTIEFGLVNGEVVETNRTVVKEYRDRTMNEDELAACPDREDPTVEPPPDTKPKPDPEPVKMPTQTKMPAAAAPKAQVQQLPRTGSSSTTAALLASGLLVAGIGSLAASRRLRRAQR